MIYEIDFLNNEQLETIIKYYDFSNFIDGKASGTDNKKIKNNLEMCDNTHYIPLRDYFGKCVQENDEFKFIFNYRALIPPGFLKYEEGMHYDYHRDLYFMNDVRNDYSVTCFLNSPDEYEGGELVLKIGGKELEYKLDAGKALIYPTGTPHKVKKITSGCRKVVVFWFESIIHDSRIRNIITDYSKVLYNNQENLPPKVIDDLEDIRFKLIRDYGII
jgi:PKHD-type hydroxylase